jgi:hypothetical protein
MAQEINQTDSHFQSDEDSIVPRRVFSLAWPIALLAAVAIHQVTGSPIAAASLLAFHAGWKPFRCGLWLKRVDPLAARGWACFWFYLATAFWRAAAWALATVFFFVIVALIAGQPPGEEEIMMEFFVLAGGICLSAAVGLVALASAFLGKVRVWVQPMIWERCHADFTRLWSLRGFYAGGPERAFNYAVFVIATSLAAPVVGFGTVLLIWSMAGARPNDPPMIPTILGLFLLFPGSLLVIPAYAIIASRIVARTPAECWPPETLTDEDLIAAAERLFLELDRREEGDG